MSYSFHLVRTCREEKKVQLDLPSEEKLGQGGGGGDINCSLLPSKLPGS